MPNTPQIEAVQQLGRTYRSILSAFENNIGHSMPRWRILTTLHRRGQLSQKDLARELSMDPAALTRQIKAIEALGWVSRASAPHDNRITNVQLTSRGTAMVQEALPRRSAFFNDLFGDMPARDIKTLIALLEAIERRIR